MITDVNVEKLALLIKELDHLASYAQTVRLDRQKVVDGNIMDLQTHEWCIGLLEVAQQALVRAKELGLL